MPLPELGAASTHNFSLANQLGAEFTSVKSEVYIEVDPVEGSLRRIHALEIRLQILAR